MPRSGPARARTRWTRLGGRRAAGVLVAIAAIAAAFGAEPLVSSSLTVHAPSRVRSSSWAAPPIDHSRSEQIDALGEAGGAVPDGTTVFDDDVPGVAKLD